MVLMQPKKISTHVLCSNKKNCTTIQWFLTFGFKLPFLDEGSVFISWGVSFETWAKAICAVSTFKVIDQISIAHRMRKRPEINLKLPLNQNFPKKSTITNMKYQFFYDYIYIAFLCSFIIVKLSLNKPKI